MKKADPKVAERRKRQIVDAAAQCFAERGFHQTNMQAIAQTANLSAGLIYRYFDSKEALILAFVEHQNEELAEGFSWVSDAKRFKKALSQLAEAYLKEFADDAFAGLMAEILAEALRNDAIRQALTQSEMQTKQQLIQLLKQAQTNGQVTLALSPEATAYTLLALLEGMGSQLGIDKKLSLRKAKRMVLDTLDLLVFEQ